MKLFIWDFHGTLEKGSEWAAYEITNRVLHEYGYDQRMDEGLVRQLYGKKWYEYFIHLLPHESKETHIALQKRCFEVDLECPEIIERAIKSNDHAASVLKQIGNMYDQILISNTAQERLKDFLRMTDMQELFPEGKYFGVDAHRLEAHHSKQEIANGYLVGKDFEKVIVIGDSPQDMIPLPNAVHYLYAHPGNPFKECGADYRIRDLREVLREI